VLRNAKNVFSSKFSRYVVVSGIALCADIVSYWLLTVATGTTALPLAAAASYSVGLVMAFFLITRYVFRDGWLSKTKILEAIVFFLTGLLGVFLTYGIVAMYAKFIGEHIYAPKLLAVSISFISVYFFRKYVVFKT